MRAKCQLQPSLLKGMQVMQCGFGTYSSPVSAQMEHHSKLPSAARRIAYAPNGESARGGQNQGRGWRRTAMPQTGWMRNVGGRRGENVPGTVAPVPGVESCHTLGAQVREGGQKREKRRKRGRKGAEGREREGEKERVRYMIYFEVYRERERGQNEREGKRGRKREREIERKEGKSTGERERGRQRRNGDEKNEQKSKRERKRSSGYASKQEREE